MKINNILFKSFLFIVLTTSVPFAHADEGDGGNSQTSQPPTSSATLNTKVEAGDLNVLPDALRSVMLSYLEPKAQMNLALSNKQQINNAQNIPGYVHPNYTLRPKGTQERYQNCLAQYGISAFNKAPMLTKNLGTLVGFPIGCYLASQTPSFSPTGYNYLDTGLDGYIRMVVAGGTARLVMKTGDLIHLGTKAISDKTIKSLQEGIENRRLARKVPSPSIQAASAK